jgi:hypothetical protein
VAQKLPANCEGDTGFQLSVARAEMPVIPLELPGTPLQLVA